MPGTFGDTNTARLHALMAQSEDRPEPEPEPEPEVDAEAETAIEPATPVA